MGPRPSAARRWSEVGKLARVVDQVVLRDIVIAVPQGEVVDALLPVGNNRTTTVQEDLDVTRRGIAER